MIQWFPGHMKKAINDVSKIAKVANIFLVVLDARIPFSSYNSEFDKIAPNKPRLFIIAKRDLADTQRLAALQPKLSATYKNFVVVNLKKPQDIKKILQRVTEIILRHRTKNTFPKAIVLGVPNVGKSTLINAFANKRVTKTSNKPGVTRGRQWISLENILVMDTPGILLPKFDSPEVAIKVAMIGSVRQEILEKQEVVYAGLKIFQAYYPNKLPLLGLSAQENLETQTLEALQKIATKKAIHEKTEAAQINKTLDFVINFFRDLKGVTYD